MVEYHKKKYYVFLNDTYEPLRKLDSKIVQEADGNFTYNPSPITMSSPSTMNQYPQYENSSSVPFTSDHISSFVESQLASFKYDPMEEEEPSTSPEVCENFVILRKE